MSRRAWTQTIADGRHEWRRAANNWERLVVALTCVCALLRVFVCLTWAEASAAMATSLVRRWLVSTSAVSVFVWAGVPLLRGRWPSHFYLVDLGEAFVTLAMPTFLVAALTRRPAHATPRLGTLAVVVGTLLVWLLILVPFGLAARYTVFYHGAIYASVAWPIVTQWVVVTMALAWAAIGLTDRVIVHERRPFLTTLSLLLPVGAMMFAASGQSQFAEIWNRWHVVPYALFGVAATLGVAVLWVGLAWESHASRARDGQ